MITRHRKQKTMSNFDMLKCFLAQHRLEINQISHFGFVFVIEPKNAKEVLVDVDWVNAMHEELDQLGQCHA